MLAAVGTFDTERQRGRHELGAVGMLTIPARAADRTDQCIDLYEGWIV